MRTIAIILRGLQFYAHNAHNLAKGPNFMQDHAFFGDLYESYEEQYDSVVERIIGESGDDAVELSELTQFASELNAKDKPTSSAEAYSSILEQEGRLCDAIKGAISGESDGTQNLLQGIADSSLVRQYKIQRRLKGK